MSYAATLGGLSALIAVVSFLTFSPMLALVSCALGWTMLAIAATDLRWFIVPDLLSLPAIPAGLLAAPLLDPTRGPSSSLLEHAGAAVLGGAALYAVRYAYYSIRKREGLGLGDVKLAAAAGAWTGPEGLGLVLLLACLLAIAAVVLTHLRQLRMPHGTTAVAFGMFLAPSIWLVWCLGALSIYQ
jgi:leader peptidase (prepilin peptidase)/N-methyltransferase